jgi:hypothetical protein
VGWDLVVLVLGIWFDGVFKAHGNGWEDSWVAGLDGRIPDAGLGLVQTCCNDHVHNVFRAHFGLRS